MSPVANRGMGRILKGVLEYQSNLKGELVPFFREILDRPAPKSIIVTCVDSRIVTSRLLQSEPGAYFLIRSPGNFIPKFECLDTSVPSGTPAALELACVINKANTIAVVGNSDSKILNILYDMRQTLNEQGTNGSALKNWLMLNGRDTVAKFAEFEKEGFKKALTFSEANSLKFEAYIDPENQFDVKDKFSQINTLEQLKNVQNYNFLKESLERNSLRAYALWTDMYKNELYLFSFKEKRFIKIDEKTYEKLYKECETKLP